MLINIFSQSNSIFLFDELMNGLDAKTVQELSSFFNAYFLVQPEKRFIYITHRLEKLDVIQFNKLCIFTDDGTIIARDELDRNLLFNIINKDE